MIFSLAKSLPEKSKDEYTDAIRMMVIEIDRILFKEKKSQYSNK